MKPLRLLLALALLPLASGALVVTYQDALLTHYPARAVMAQQLRSGEFPFLHPGASCVQPLAGNPNFGAFFPDALLLAILPLPVAFGCRFALVLLLGWAGARRLARAEGLPRAAAEVAATAFVLSGVFLSTWRFFNSGLALAVVPWVLAAAVKLIRTHGSRRALAELGLWGGLEVLAGEPVIALLTALVVAARALATPSRRALAALAGAVLIAGLVAAPQIAATLQVLPDSSRERRPFPFIIAAGTSVHPARLLEQVVPFPFGRPDRRGGEGFTGHAFFDNHAPYLWTLHLGLPVIGLLVAFGRARSREERLYVALAATAALLAFGRYLPGAKALYPLLSLGGRIRFPVKWWYVVLVCLVPLVARAAARWEEGERPRRAAVVTLLLAVAAVIAWQRPPTPLVLAGAVFSVAALVALVFAPRWPGLLAAVVAASLGLGGLPLFLAVLDRPPSSPARVGTGRIYSRVLVEAHPRDAGGAGAVRDFFRRGPAELWPLLGAVTEVGYAFDRDPDGLYGDDDRAQRKALDALPWPERAPALRAAGVSSVIATEPLPPPYREVAFLNEAEGVRLYALGEPAPSVRLPGGRVVEARETVGRLEADVEAEAAGVVVWSRSFLSGWWAMVDGRAVAPVLAEGHLVGIPVPAGWHRVEAGWSKAGVVAGGILAALGLMAAGWLRRKA